MRESAMLATPPANTFKAILWKELRENLKWAVVGLLGLSAGLVYGIQSALPAFFNSNYSNGEDLLSVFTVTTFGGAILGLALGLAQSIPENRGDKWGFLAHRPVRRSTLFWGKVFSGVLIYVFATAVPTTIALLWLLSPGHVPAPFNLHIALPAIADLLCGLVYYFVGLMTGMRDARWYASRALGIGAAFICSLVVNNVEYFSIAVVVAAAGILVVGAAAWGTFTAGGRYEPQSRTCRIAVGLSVGSGIAVLGGVVIAIIMSFIQNPAYQTSGRSRDYVVTTEGTIAQAIYEDGQLAGVEDIQGKPIEKYKTSTAANKLTAGVVGIDTLWLKAPWQNPGYRNLTRIYSRLHPLSAPYNGGRSNWYYVRDLNLAAEYSNRTGKLLGWLGPDGYSAVPNKPRSFDGMELRRGSSFYPVDTLLAFSDSVYRMDLDQRHIEKLFVPEAGESVLAAASTGENSSMMIALGVKSGLDVIATTNRVIIRSPNGDRLLETPHDPLAPGYESLEVQRALLAEGMPIFLWYKAFRVRAAQDEWPIQSTEFKMGAATNHLTLPQRVDGNQMRWREFLPVLSVIPVSLRVGLTVYQRIKKPGPLPWDAWKAGTIVSWALPIALAFVFAFLSYRRGATYAFAAGRLWFWTLLPIVLGPLAYCMMLALLEWPALEKCSACGRRRVVTHEHCEHCSEPFAPPAMDGTEIFDLKFF